MKKTTHTTTRKTKRVKTKVCKFCAVIYKPPIFDEERKECGSCNFITDYIQSFATVMPGLRSTSQQSTRYWTDKISKLL